MTWPLKVAGKVNVAGAWKLVLPRNPAVPKKVTKELNAAVPA